jgi:hypothetical protein
MPHRPDIHRWYCTASWQPSASAYGRACQLCLEAGHVTPATVADGIEPHRGHWNAFRLGPLRSLCAE